MSASNRLVAIDRASIIRDALTSLAILCVFLLSACALPSRLAAVPDEATIRAAPLGMMDVRYFADTDPQSFVRGALESLKREKDFLARSGHKGELPPAHFLAISGGGDNGAFGAGLLVGWTEAGTRPEFKMVTGVSTGALTAPFAFLGPEYDDDLRNLYTTIKPDDIFRRRTFLAAVIDDALADSAPLRKLVERYFSEEMLREIAKEYARGRILLIATTNLDARRSVIWDIGAIASSGHPRALELVRTVLVASSALPGAFPPVMIDVVVDGMTYQEMHVDGGAMAQVFVYPGSVDANKLFKTHGITRERRLYAIRNSQLNPRWQSVTRRTLKIVGRAIESLIQSQGIGDLYKIYLLTQRDGIDYNLAYIDSDFEKEHKYEFDQAYMQALFDYGYRLASKGYRWRKTPPGFTTSKGQ